MYKEVCAFNTCEYEVYCPNCNIKIIKKLTELLENVDYYHTCQGCGRRYVIKW